MSKKELLFQIADSQQGFFTAKQAENAGYLRPNFPFMVKSGEWTHEEKGIYRLKRYPTTSRPELVLWYLWSRNIQDIPQGIWSHETALDIHDLSDVMPSKMHMTVPVKFRKGAEIPKHLILHRKSIIESDIQKQEGYKVTTPFKTITDCIEDRRLTDDLIFQAIFQALERALIGEKELIQLKFAHPHFYQKMKEIYSDKFF